MKKILTSIFFAALGLSLSWAQNFGAAASIPTLPKSQVLDHDEVIAVVEDTTITRSELNRALMPFIQNLRSTSRTQEEYIQKINKLSRELLQNMIDKVILIKEFHAKGMVIPQSVLESIYDEDLKKRFNGNRSEFLKYLQSQNKTIKEYRKEQEEDVIVNHMQNQQRLTASEISPQRIIEYYNANKQQWYTPESVKISQITLKGATPDEAMELAKEVYSEIQGGMKFEDAAKKYSQDETSAKGGEWGWYRRGELNPVLDKKAFESEIGKVTEPVSISNYAYILRVDEKKKEGIEPLDDVREKIEWTLAADNAKIEYEKWIKRLRERAYIKYFNFE